ERAARKAAVLLPLRDIAVGIRVDDEEVEPAVVVVVEPAEPAAHHRAYVVRHPVAERALPEVEADPVRDVGEPDADRGRERRDRLLRRAHHPRGPASPPQERLRGGQTGYR